LGTIGQVLTSQGVGANPQWTTIGAGTLTSVTTTNATPQFVLAGTVENINFGITNLILGSNGAITSAARNTGYGNGSLNALTSGTDNIAVGTLALTLLTSGTNNTALGSGALSAITMTSGNTAIGFSAGNALTGSTNVIVGAQAMPFATNAISNVAIGTLSLESATSAISNVALGYNSLSGVTSGSNNIAIGPSVASAFTSTESNNLIIYNAGVVADANTIRIGTQGSGASQQNKCFIAGIVGVTVSNPQTVVVNSVTGQLGVGAGSGPSIETITGNTGGAESPDGSGNFNIVTANATVVFAGTANTETLDFGITNLVLGSSLPSLAGGSSNVGYGRFSLNALTTGSSNAAFGVGTLQSLTSGSGNTAIGTTTLNGLIVGNNNTAVGAGAMTIATGGTNTTLGYQGLFNLTSGSNNLAIGTASPGSALTTESNNLLIYSAGVAADANTIRIGTQGNLASQQNKVFLAGIIGVTVPNAAATVVVDTVTGQLGVGAGPGPAIETLTGDTGGPLGPTGGNFNIIANVATLNAGSSVLFAGAGSTLTFDVTDANNNTMIGNTAGKAAMSGTLNTALGYEAGSSLTSGQYNTLLGATAGGYITDGSGNTVVGEVAMAKNTGGTTSSYNTAIGYGALFSVQDPGGSHVAINTALGYEAGFFITTGVANIMIGPNSGGQLTTGSFNTIIGNGSSGGNILSGSYNILLGGNGVGSAYSGAESSNILISNQGVNAESNTMRLGTSGSTAGKVSTTYIAGIAGVAVANQQSVVINSATGQLGTSNGGVTGWSVVAVNGTFTANTGVIANKAGLLTMTLPALSAIGDTYKITNLNTNLGWAIAQNAGQSIRFGNVATTVGVAGSLACNQVGDGIEFICVVANTTFHVLNSIGGISVN
jgi:hypothetical protein